MNLHRTGHPYLRAYMAGIAIPAVLLVAVPLVCALASPVWERPYPVERIFVFPMAVVPNAWGLWNILYLALRLDGRLPIGWYGAMLPFVLVPLIWLAVAAAGVEASPALMLIPMFGVAAIYYVLWRYVVAALNEIVGVASEFSPRTS